MSDFRSQGMEGDRGVRCRGYIGARGNMDGGGGGKWMTKLRFPGAVVPTM